MNEEVKAKWIGALRSGEYSQTSECLKDDNGFCCLGVLTDLAVKDGVIDPWQHQPGENFYFVPDDNNDINWPEASLLPNKVMKWAGLDSRNPTVEWGATPVPISDPNDHGATFDEIADMIEEQL